MDAARRHPASAIELPVGQPAMPRRGLTRTLLRALHKPDEPAHEGTVQPAADGEIGAAIPGVQHDEQGRQAEADDETPQGPPDYRTADDAGLPVPRHDADGTPQAWPQDEHRDE